MKDVKEGDPAEEFNFYIKFAKPLVLNLPDTNDRVRAAAWLQKLRSMEDSESASLRNDYLKLLLFVLQRRQLIGPFSELPEKDAPLKPFPEDAKVMDVAKQLLVDHRGKKKEDDSVPPYMVEVSSDLKEYAVAQEIPDFGVHCYFAVSTDPISQWENADKGKFPKVHEKVIRESLWDTTAPGVKDVLYKSASMLPSAVSEFDTILDSTNALQSTATRTLGPISTGSGLCPSGTVAASSKVSYDGTTFNLPPSSYRKFDMSVSGDSSFKILAPNNPQKVNGNPQHSSYNSYKVSNNTSPIKNPNRYYGNGSSYYKNPTLPHESQAMQKNSPVSSRILPHTTAESAYATPKSRYEVAGSVGTRSRRDPTLSSRRRLFGPDYSTDLHFELPEIESTITADISQFHPPIESLPVLEKYTRDGKSFIVRKCPDTETHAVTESFEAPDGTVKTVTTARNPTAETRTEMEERKRKDNGTFHHLKKVKSTGRFDSRGIPPNQPSDRDRSRLQYHYRV